jgi:hypothetical protein
MRFIFAALLLVFSACVAGNEGGESAADSYQSHIGRDYFELRQRLLSDGFAPIAAVCSEKLLCTDHEELATSLSYKDTCGVFFHDRKGRIRVCVEAVPDRWIVKTIRNHDSD